MVLAAAGLWLLGLGLWAEPWKSAEVVSGPRVEVAAAHSSPSILFGDLHVHTSFSLDAALFGLPLVTDSDIALPSDACDFARYCSALDFWSINDHAEGMTPRSWQDSVQAIRDCNAQSGELIRERCEEPDSIACEQRVETARSYAAEVLDDRSRAVVSGATPADWGNCGQLLNSFLPAWYYIPRQSTQYNLALGDFSATGSPQRSPGEPVADLIEDNWRVFDCPAAGQGCEIEFEDAEFSRAGRETLYYARAIQEPQATINGDNFRCEYNAAGECVKFNFCIDEQAPPGEDCLAPAEPRAWSSPIFLDFQ